MVKSQYSHPHNLCTCRTACESPLGTCYRFFLLAATLLSGNHYLNSPGFDNRYLAVINHALIFLTIWMTAILIYVVSYRYDSPPDYRLTLIHANELW